jgi:D-arginine dehydrogenase
LEADFLIIGGGVAGLSAAAALAPHGSVLLLEAEAALGHHSSGRSATFSHFGIGNDVVRRLTAYSRAFFQAPPEGVVEVPLARRASALFIATEATLPEMDRLEVAMRAHAPEIRRCEQDELTALFPPLRTGGGAAVAGLLDEDGLRLDADALLQAYARRVRSLGGTILPSAPASTIARTGAWEVTTADGAVHRGQVLINAAGAWADVIAERAGVPPLGLLPKRRTIIIVDPPHGANVAAWPFVKTVVDDFYILPEAGRLIASPVDEVPSEPCDAQPDDYDIALAAWKVEQYTTLPVPRVSHRWAGLRTFAPDRTPVVGFDPRAEGFFWLAGQGGFGLQTAPALAEAAAALARGSTWPKGLEAAGIQAQDLAPERLI